METKYNPQQFEKRIYEMWERSGVFSPKIDPKRNPFTIILPPPNASGKMHTGNVLMIAIEDLLIRYHRMLGEPTLWLPGTDHAGIETQTTFERELKKKGKSRFDFDRETFYKMVWDYVQDNKGLILQQLKNMGASVDWSRLKFTLDSDVIQTIYATFQKMINDGLIYIGDNIVNYSFKHGTTFSDAEIVHTEKEDDIDSEDEMRTRLPALVRAAREEDAVYSKAPASKQVEPPKPAEETKNDERITDDSGSSSPAPKANRRRTGSGPKSVGGYGGG